MTPSINNTPAPDNAATSGTFRLTREDGTVRSGSDLKGTARKYASGYAQSRKALFARLQADLRLSVRIETQARGLRVLVIEAA